MKPVLLVTGHAPAYRVGAFAALHEREGIEVALFGGRSLHGGPDAAIDLPFPHRHVYPREVARLAAAGEHRGVIASTGGRMALLGAWGGARAARRPLILWASLWAHPRTPAHTLSRLPLRRLYRRADAVVTYGPHVSDYVRALGATRVFEAPQAVDNGFWGADETGPPDDPRWPGTGTRFLFAGRAAPGKGLDTLLAAWRAAGLGDGGALVLAGVGARPRTGAGAANGAADGAAGAAGAAGADGADGAAGADGGRVLRLDPLTPHQLRRAYAAAEVLVLPSVATANFREPWGLVVNEAMNRGLAVIASDAVGAAAGGLVRDGVNGLVVPAGDPGALARAMRRLAADPQLRAQLGAQGREDVQAYTYAAWAEGFSRALASVGLARDHW